MTDNNYALVDLSTGEVATPTGDFNIGDKHYSEIAEKGTEYFGTLFFPLFVSDDFKALDRAKQNGVLLLMDGLYWRTGLFSRVYRNISKKFGIPKRTVEDLMPELEKMNWIAKADTIHTKRYMFNPSVFSKTGAKYRAYLAKRYCEYYNGLVFQCKELTAQLPFATVYKGFLQLLTTIKGNSTVNFVMFLISKMDDENRVRTRNHSELQADSDGKRFGLCRQQFSKMVKDLTANNIICKTKNGFMVNPVYVMKTSLDNRENLINLYTMEG